MHRRVRMAWILVPALALAASAWAISAQAGDANGNASIQGGGTSIISGGTGAPSFAPIITKFTVFKDGLQIEKETGKDPYFLGASDWELAGACLDGAARKLR